MVQVNLQDKHKEQKVNKVNVSHIEREWKGIQYIFSLKQQLLLISSHPLQAGILVVIGNGKNQNSKKGARVTKCDNEV